MGCRRSTRRHRPVGRRAEDVVVARPDHVPHLLGDLTGQLPRRPAGVAGEDPQVGVRAAGDDLDRGVEVQQPDPVEQRGASRVAPRPASPRWPGRSPRSATPARRGTAAAALTTTDTQSGSTDSSVVWEISFKITPSAPSSSLSSTSTTVWSNTPSVSSALATSRSPGSGSATLTGALTAQPSAGPATAQQPERQPAQRDADQIGDASDGSPLRPDPGRAWYELADHRVGGEHDGDHGSPERPQRPAGSRGVALPASVRTKNMGSAKPKACCALSAAGNQAGWTGPERPYSPICWREDRRGRQEDQQRRHPAGDRRRSDRVSR